MSDLSFEQVIELLVEKYFGAYLAAELPGKPNVGMPKWDVAKSFQDARESVRVFHYNAIPFTLRVAAPSDFRGEVIETWKFSEKAPYAPMFAAILWLSRKIKPELDLEDMRCIEVKHGGKPSMRYIELTLWQTADAKGVLSTVLPTEDIWATDSARLAFTLFALAFAETDDAGTSGQVSSLFSVWLYRTMSGDPTVSPKFSYTVPNLFVEVTDALSGFANVTIYVSKKGRRTDLESMLRYQLQQL